MRQWVICGVMVLSTVSFLQADYTPVEICVDSDNQVAPDIDGDIVVWQDDRNGIANMDIYWKHFGDPNDPNTILISGNQKNPAVSGDIIVWQDEQVSTNRNIYGYNRETREVFAVCTATGNQENPDISGDIIVWQDRRYGNADIFLYRISTQTEEAVCTDGAGQLFPAIDGNIVVWHDNRSGKYQIYQCDLSVTPYVAEAVSPSDYDQLYPAVSGDIIVWHEDRGGTDGVDVYAYDVSKGQLTLLAGGPGIQNFATVSGTIAVWQQVRTGGADFNIRGCDLSTGAYFDIATGTLDDTTPVISGRRVVWQRMAADKDIMGAVIPTPTTIEVIWPVSGEMFLAKSKIEVDWELVDGTAPATVKIEFSSDGGAGWQTVAASVPFGEVYMWMPIADVDSQQCKIRVSDAADTMVGDISDVFTIFQCSAALTADLSGDCFVGLEDFAIMAGQWMGCGNLYDLNWCVE